tara:strand:- start:7962 stop:8216 length:255 start_codon:yes stop_codon:yes gene_type:complete
MEQTLQTKQLGARMTLDQLLGKLEELKKVHGGDIVTEFVIPATSPSATWSATRKNEILKSDTHKASDGERIHDVLNLILIDTKS